MSNKYAKKYKWLKLPKGFFKRHDIRIIEGMDNGKEIVMFYMKLLCESLDHDGKLRFSEKVPYTNAMLATVTNTDPEIAEQAMEVLKQLHLVEVDEDGTLFMTEEPGMVGAETGMAQYMREYREQEREQEEVITMGLYDNVRMTRRELKELKDYFPSSWEEYVEKLSAYKKANGKDYENDAAQVMKMLREDKGDFEPPWEQ